MKYNFFDGEFLEKYKTKTVPFGPLGYITYKRTYARWIPIENRSEEWWETCSRVLNGNFNLELKHTHNEYRFDGTHQRLTAEAHQAYDDMFNMRWLPPGRGLWMSGTEASEKNGATLTNCYFVEVQPGHGKASHPFCFAMDMLMSGAGVGFGVSSKSIELLPTPTNEVELFIICKPTHRDYQFLNSDKVLPAGDYDTVNLSDTRQGWVRALRKVIDYAYESKRGNTQRLVIDVSQIRAAGERIKGFGGIASGPHSLIELLRSVNKLLNKRHGTELTDVDCTDLMTLIGRCVVSGNVRRSAMIALGDITSKDFINMKNPYSAHDFVAADIIEDEFHNEREYLELPSEQEIEQHNESINHHRWASNNSVFINDSYSDYDALAQSIWVKGEPGFINLDLVQNYGRIKDGRCEALPEGDSGAMAGSPRQDLGATGTNPCGEISLESFEPCNLSEIFPSNCKDMEEVRRVAITAYRYAKRVTLSHYPWAESQDVVVRNRRIGVSISGIQDWLLQEVGNVHIEDCEARVNDELKLHITLSPSTVLKDKLDELYQLIRAEDERFSTILGVNTSIKLTTVKPSGTISLLAGVSPGIHFPYASFYIRRIQFQDTDPLVAYLSSLGFTTHAASQTPRAVVVEFPIKTPTGEMLGFQSAGDVDAEFQLKMQLMLQTYWADNQVSCTVSLQEGDKEKLPDLLKRYSKLLKSTSFLPYSPSLKEHYPDLPYEPITQEQYEEMMGHIKEWPSKLPEDVQYLEISNDECAGGVCPVK